MDLRTLEQAAQRMARTIGGALPNGVGFTLLHYDFGPGGFTTFVSNGQREDTVAALIELLQGLIRDTPGGRREVVGRALHRIITAADDLWSELDDEERAVWCDDAEELLKLAVAAP